MAQLNFDARTVVPDAGQQDPVPAGWYKVVIDKSEMKPTKDGTGMRLELQFKIIDGQYTNRKIFEGLNLQNANPVAQEIAYKQLSAICHSVNVLVAEDSQQLHNIPLQVKVILKAATSQYEAKNEIKAYKNINEVVAPSPTAAAAPGAPASFAPPPAPAAFAPPAAPGSFAPPPAAAAPATWTPPAAAQPWAGAPAAPAPVAAPIAAPAAVPVAPAWAAAPAPVAAAPAPAAVAAPAANPAAGLTPPWATAPTA